MGCGYGCRKMTTKIKSETKSEEGRDSKLRMNESNSSKSVKLEKTGLTK